MSSSSLTPGMHISSTWLHRWIYYLAAGFMFAAAALRSLLLFQASPLLGQILLLLAGWLLIFIVDALLARKLPWLSAFLVGLEMLAILQLLRVTHSDYFAFLFALPSMQVMQQYSLKEAVTVVGITTVLTFLSLHETYGVFYAIAIAVVFFGGTIFLVMYIRATRQARQIEVQQQELVSQLTQANRQLEFHAQQAQQLAAGRERQRLARELHDSVTQTIFSMTLTTQSALLLMERDRSQLEAQLERLYQLAHTALAEMHTLITRLTPEKSEEFVAKLQRHLEERRRMDSLFVSLQVQGGQALTSLEQQSLFRIAQEALNNVLKHSGVNQASLLLHLEGEPCMEIMDRGRGFDPLKARDKGQLGLLSMQERAFGIGWRLRVISSPDKGTRVRVWKESNGERPS
jgi:signal transduction histidine kinase